MDSDLGSCCCKDAHVACKSGPSSCRLRSTARSVQLKAVPERSNQSTPSMAGMTSDPGEWALATEWLSTREQAPVVSGRRVKRVILQRFGTDGFLRADPVVTTRRHPRFSATNSRKPIPRRPEHSFGLEELSHAKDDPCRRSVVLRARCRGRRPTPAAGSEAGRSEPATPRSTHCPAGS